MEYLSGRFNPVTHQTFSWITIFFQLFTSASTLYGFSLFVSSACGFPVIWTIVGAGGSDRFLLRAGWPVGSGSDRFSASLNSDAVLPGAA